MEHFDYEDYEKELKQEEKTFKVFSIISLILFILAIIIICTWPVEDVKAFEYAQYTQQINVGNTTYYGYYVPTRWVDPNYYNNKVRIGLTNSSGQRMFTGAWNPQKQECFNLVDGCEKIGWTKFYSDSWNTNFENSFNYMSIAFSPGQESTISDMLSNNIYVDYDSQYTYDFYIRIIALDDCPDNHNCQLNLPRFTGFTQKVDNVWRVYQTSIRSDMLDIAEVYRNNDTLIYKYSVNTNGIGTDITKFNNNEFVYDNSHTAFRFNGNNLTGFILNDTNRIGYYDSTEGKYLHYSIAISEPRNIYLWSTDSGLFCQDTCQTQEDVDNLNIYREESFENEEQNLLRSLFSIDFFDDFGLSGVITHLFDKLRYYFAFDYNDSCYAYNINVLGTTLTFDCGYNFWNRQDINEFKYIWNIFWTALIGFFIAKYIYIKLLSLVDVNSSVQVDVKEVYRL